MKFAPLFLLLLAAASFSGCNTLVNCRDLYRPARGDGYWTKRLNRDRKGEGIFGISNSYHPYPKPGPEEGLLGISHPTYPPVEPARQ